jgi:hypothetical protein
VSVTCSFLIVGASCLPGRPGLKRHERGAWVWTGRYEVLDDDGLRLGAKGTMQVAGA